MNLTQSQATNRGAKHRIKRLGRGESSGQGKTSGRGHKGPEIPLRRRRPPWIRGWTDASAPPPSEAWFQQRPLPGQDRRGQRFLAQRAF